MTSIDDTHVAPRLSLRLRLTLWVVAVFAVVQVTLMVVLALYQESSMNEFFNERLRRRGVSAVERIRDRVPGIAPDELWAEAQSELNFVLFEEFFLAVYRADGTLLAASGEPAKSFDSGLIEEGLALASPSVMSLEIDLLPDHSPDARSTRTALVPMRGRDGEMYLLVAATADTYARRMISLVWTNTFIAIAVGLIAAGVAGWFIAGMAVAPFKRLRDFAQHLSPESIGEEVDVEAGDVEVARLEADLEAARERLAQGFASQERFMANVSHELKTPVAVLMTESETIDLNDANPGIRDFVKSARDEMWRLGRMIDSFLLLTRVRDGSRRAHGQRYLANELLMDAFAQCSKMAEQYDVRLCLNLLDGAHVDTKVEGDPSLLCTMLNNLVRNAIRFSPKGDIVELRCEERTGDIWFHVRDRGSGIPDDLIERIFDRFAQSAHEERRGRGHGLGLEIAQGIAELHGGEITVRNCESSGSEFSVRLPAASPAEPPDVRHEPS